MKTNTITKYIIKAVFAEGISAILICVFFYSIFFSFADTVEIFTALWFPIISGIAVMYLLGRLIGGWFPEGFRFQIGHGIVIIFTLLFAGIMTGFFATALLPHWDSYSIIDVFPLLLVFLLFGGLPTVFVGIWLGSMLKKYL